MKLLPMFTPPLTPPPLRVLAPKPSSCGFQHDASMPLFRRLQRGGQPAIAAADDRHAHAPRQVDGSCAVG